MIQNNQIKCRRLSGNKPATSVVVYVGIESLKLPSGSWDGTDSLVILLCGGDKATQSRDIERTQEYWADYLKE